jgi:hypothetical protein
LGDVCRVYKVEEVVFCVGELREEDREGLEIGVYYSCHRKSCQLFVGRKIIEDVPLSASVALASGVPKKILKGFGSPAALLHVIWTVLFLYHVV